MTNFEQKKKTALALFHKLKQHKQVSLKPKSTTHFFRTRSKPNPFDLRSFNQVITVNTEEKYVEVEGLTTFYHLAEATLKHGYMPAVVPELRNITIGGAISGLGVEASSFRYGLVHENVTEMEILTGNGEAIKASAQENADLFATVPNSLGTLGYVLKCKVRLIPIKKFVSVRFTRFTNAKAYFEEMKSTAKKQEADFLEGIVYGHEHFVLVVGNFTDELPDKEKLFNVQDQAWYRYVKDRRHDTAFFTTKSFLWRWDPDVYWGTAQPGLIGVALNNPLLRKTILRGLLRSDRLLRLNRFLDHNSLFVFLRKLQKKRVEPLVQDAGINIDLCAPFFEWYKKEIEIYPIWICPVKTPEKKDFFPLYKKLGEFVVDIGFYASKKLKSGMPDNHYNKLVEEELMKLGAVKGLYSTSFYEWEDFWLSYDEKRYFEVKKKYDSENTFPNLYEKVVGKKTK